MKLRIRDFRKAKGWTLKGLADACNTTPQTIQRLETGNMTVSTDWLEKIGAALGVEPADLISAGRLEAANVEVIGEIASNGELALLPHGERRQLDLIERMANLMAIFQPGASDVKVRFFKKTLAPYNFEGKRTVVSGCVAKLNDAPPKVCNAMKFKGVWGASVSDCEWEPFDNNTEWVAVPVFDLVYPTD